MVKIWKILGIELIGYISPDNISAGNNPIDKAIWEEENCSLYDELILSPIPRQHNKYNPPTKTSIR